MKEQERRGNSLLLPLIFLFILYQITNSPLIVIAIAIWYFGLIFLEENGILDKWDATRVLGIILMLRTKQGQKVLDLISSKRKFWRIYGEISIWVCLFVMAGVILLLVLSFGSSVANPPNDPIPPQDLLLIPGVTSFVPFWWPVLALIIAIVIHEYSHGIQARAHGMKIRSFGLLLVGPLPMGAFAEPEQEEMYRAPRRDRMRLFAAGPSINLFATYLVIILLSSTATGFVAKNPGVHAEEIIVDTGAAESGLLPYEIITHMNGEPVPNYDIFSSEMDNYSPGEQIVLTVLSGQWSSENLNENIEENERNIEITLIDRYEWEIGICEKDPVCDLDDAEDFLISQGIGPDSNISFLGVRGLKSGTGGVDRYSPIINGISDYGIIPTLIYTAVMPIIMLGVPLSGEGQIMDLREQAMLSAGDGVLASLIGTDGMIMLFTFLFWLAWINFLLGFANLIPMVPFDGGHILRDAVHSVLVKTDLLLKRNIHPIKLESWADKISNNSSFLFLFILIIPIILSYFP
jgi:membrane-associated protease RseP (regulator of RpoE activity)|tara:strand:+ start:2061 stop:3617 length:1557 start_codon:yes stop_codon:yes gene_type:complete